MLMGWKPLMRNMATVGESAAGGKPMRTLPESGTASSAPWNGKAGMIFLSPLRKTLQLMGLRWGKIVSLTICETCDAT